MWVMSQSQAERTVPGGLMSSQSPSLVFSKCAFFGGEGLGQCQPIPVSVTKRAWEQSPNPPLLLAVDRGRAVSCSCLVGL